jgi:tetratricopeptide (TPR) repeat protein
MRNRRVGMLVLLVMVGVLLSACAQQKTVEQYLEDGQRHLENGDVSKAIAALEEALKKDPTLEEAHRLLGEALGESERWPEAIKELEAYQSLAKQDPEAYYLLGQAYVKTDQLEKAAGTFAQGVSLDPALAEAYQQEISEASEALLEAGREAIEAGNLQTANELLTAVAPLVPGQGEVYYLLGQAQMQGGNLDQALVAFADAVQLSPEMRSEYATEIDALVERGLETGQAALDAGNLEGAAQAVEAVTRLSPQDAQAFFLLGNIYNQANQLEQAIQAYNKVLDLNPDSSSAQTNLGVVYYKMGDLETAIQKYESALELEPDDAETHYLLGAAYLQQDRLQEGQAEFEKALELNDQLAPAYIGLGNVYLLQGDLESAVQALEEAIALTPDSPEAYFALGQAQIQLGNMAEAKAALERVLELNPDPHWQQQAEQILESLDSN